MQCALAPRGWAACAAARPRSHHCASDVHLDRRCQCSWGSPADIVTAAAKVFEAKGYHNSTIDDICLEAGISRPTIYKYIDNKSWLLNQMVVVVTDELGARLQEILNGPLSPREKIRAMVQLHIELATNRRVFYATVWGEQTELSEEFLQSFRTWSHNVTPDFADLIDDYLTSEGLQPKVDSAILANLTLSMLTRLFRWYDPKGSTTPNDLAEQVPVMLSGPSPQIERLGI